MEVKGSVLQSVPKFIEKKFGRPAVRKWMDGLQPDARSAYSATILPSGWYPAIPLLALPTVRLCDLFYGGNMRGAWESGHFSAEEGLSGLYRAFIAVSTPHFVIKKATTVLPTFYRPVAIELTQLERRECTVKITKFPDPHPALDARIGGWIEQCICMAGAKGVKVEMGRLLTLGHPYSEYHVSWA